MIINKNCLLYFAFYDIVYIVNVWRCFDGVRLIKKSVVPSNDDGVDVEDESYENNDKSSSKSGNKMILVEPRAYSESQQIADHLKRRNSVVCQFKTCYC